MLTVTKLDVNYGMVHAVRNVSFAIDKGSFFTLLGPSGCGKTTTLRCIAGLEEPTAGRIELDDQPFFETGRGTVVPINKRNVSMVFQSYAVWPHMTVAANVAFPLEMQGVAHAERIARAGRMLEMVGLAEMAQRPATALSGGQQQRVALARALVKGAGLLLLDEPLSNLDAKLRIQMRGELKDLQRNLGVTTLYVTHDQEEALAMSDCIAVMKGGRIIEMGPPETLYRRPNHVFTGSFLGRSTMLTVDAVATYTCRIEARSALGPIVLADTRRNAGEVVMIRPERVEIHAQKPTGAVNLFEGVVKHVEFLGGIAEYAISVGAITLTASSMAAQIHPVGAKIWLSLPPEDLVLLTANPR